MLPRAIAISTRGLLFGLPLLILVIFVSTNLLLGWDFSIDTLTSSFLVHEDALCPGYIDHLHELNLTHKINYARRDIFVKSRDDSKRSPIIRVKKKLFPRHQIIEAADAIPVKFQGCVKPLTLEVPSAPSQWPKTPHLLFGTSTDLETLEVSLPILGRWLPNTGAKLIAYIEDGAQDTAQGSMQERLEDLQFQMQSKGMQVELIRPPAAVEKSPEASLFLLKHIYENRSGETQWISLIRPETLFTSISLLASTLSKYDSREQHYVGAVSEEWWTVIHYGLMGSLRSGIFISLPLVEALMDEIDYCDSIRPVNATIGDYRIMRCINELTNIRLAQERSLHSMDLNGDLSGFFESGRIPLSLYTGKGDVEGTDNVDIDYPSMHLITDICPSCLLYRWRFNSDMILSTSYSIAKYTKGALKGARMDIMEETWDKPRSTDGAHLHPAEHSVGPVREALKLDEEKVQHRMVASKVLEDGGVRESYLHRGVNGDLDSVLEIVWRIEQ